jgi:protein-tyrosine-phosphatase
MSVARHSGHSLKNVLFVCTGNTCRSPLAEVLFRDLVKPAQDYEVRSAGVGAFSGQAASKHSAKLAKERGLDLSKHQSKAVTINLVDQATHIFALSRSHLAALLMDYPEAEAKIYLLSEFSADDKLRGKDVSDPFGGDLEDYREMQEHLDKLLPSIHGFIEQTWKLSQA